MKEFLEMVIDKEIDSGYLIRTQGLFESLLSGLFLRCIQDFGKFNNFLVPKQSYF